MPSESGAPELPTITVGWIAALRHDLATDGSLFRLDEEGLFRRLAAKALGKQVSKETLQDLRVSVGALDGMIPLPEDLAEMLAVVREDLFEFKRLPASVLAELYEYASEDLRAIANTVAFCEAELSSIGQPPRDDDAVRTGFYAHYKTLNLAARDEIVGVLANDMHRLAIQRATPTPTSLFVPPPWAYRWDPSAYDPSAFSTLGNKFLDLPIAELRALQKAAVEGEPDAWFLVGYFAHRDPVEQVRAALDQHHRLAARKQVLVPALDALGRGEFALFCSAIAPQIEGLFEDALLDHRVSPSSLLRGSLRTKVDLLQQERSYLPSYAYFAHWFPRLRNQIAHGRLPGTVSSVTAALLLLDLRFVCNLLRADDTPLSQAIWAVKRAAARDAPTVRDIIEYLLRMPAADPAVTSPEFYGLEAAIKKLERASASPEFVAGCEVLAAANRADVNALIRRAMIFLKRKARLQVDCERVLRACSSTADGALGDNPYTALSDLAAADTPVRLDGLPASAK
ncbi:MAG: hypothetical protein U0353_27475 [Sandaracinus sp.]